MNHILKPFLRFFVRSCVLVLRFFFLCVRVVFLQLLTLGYLALLTSGAFRCPPGFVLFFFVGTLLRWGRLARRACVLAHFRPEESAVSFWCCSGLLIFLVVVLPRALPSVRACHATHRPPLSLGLRSASPPLRGALAFSAPLATLARPRDDGVSAFLAVASLPSHRFCLYRIEFIYICFISRPLSLHCIAIEIHHLRLKILTLCIKDVLTH